MLSAIVSSTMEKSVREILEEEEDAYRRGGGFGHEEYWNLASKIFQIYLVYPTYPRVPSRFYIPILGKYITNLGIWGIYFFHNLSIETKGNHIPFPTGHYGHLEHFAIMAWLNMATNMVVIGTKWKDQAKITWRKMLTTGEKELKKVQQVKSKSTL